MKVYDTLELPPEYAALHRRAVRLEWLTIAFFVVAVVVLALTLGQSQAMKAAWIEDMLGVVPPIAFLVAARFRDRTPNERFPYGYHRSISVAFLAGSVALLALGGFVVYDSVTALIAGDRPPIGLVEHFGLQFWLGWLMVAVLVATMIPAILLGRVKQRIARQLHDKVLYADAQMNRADWLTAGAAALGVLGIGAGLWWADAVAATIIGADIVRDGVRTTRGAVENLMDSRPRTVDESQPHPLPDRLLAAVREQPWIADAWLPRSRGRPRLRRRARGRTPPGHRLPGRAPGRARRLGSPLRLANARPGGVPGQPDRRGRRPEALIRAELGGQG